MARPKKIGLDYFPWDVDAENDDKLSMVIGQFGWKAEFIYLKLLSYLYKEYGYFLPWNEKEQLKFAKRVSYAGDLSVNLLKDVVGSLVRWGLFDEEVFNSTQSLTSKRIQTTWLDVTRKRKDQGGQIDKKVWLINRRNPASETSFPAEETSYGQLFPAETSFPAEVIPQSKVKYKEKVKKESPPTLPLPNSGLPAFWQEAKSTFLTNQLFLEQFCVARRVPPAAARQLMEFFVQNVELKQEYQVEAELRRYFVNWFNQKQGSGMIDQEGNLKNGLGQSPQPQMTISDAREAKARDILSQFD